MEGFRKPWEKLDEETAKAYSAFCLYRNIDPSKRSLARATEIGGRKAGAWAKWSSKFRWVERCRAWDEHIAEKANEDAERQERAWKDRTRFLRRNAIEKGLGLLLGELERRGAESLADSDILALAKTLREYAREGREEADEGPTHRVALADADLPDQERLGEILAGHAALVRTLPAAGGEE